jgi:hypothetical protein
MGQMEMKCILYFYIGQGYPGERCGPWASCCFFFLNSPIMTYETELMLHSMYISVKS